jgi:hypothetical protein
MGGHHYTPPSGGEGPCWANLQKVWLLRVEHAPFDATSLAPALKLRVDMAACLCRMPRAEGCVYRPPNTDREFP